jgi:O-antigen/teichoic acid export membrane protein
MLAVAFKYHMIVLVVLSAIMGLFAFEILALMTAPQYHAAAPLLPLAALAMIVLATKYHFEYGILRQRMTKYHMYINTSSAALHVLLNAVLIQWIGLWGAMAALLVAYSAKSVSYLLISQRLFFIPYPLGQFGALLALSSAVVFASDLTIPVTVAGFFIKCLLALLLPTIPFMLGMLKRSDINYWMTVVRSRLGGIPAG